MKALRKVREVMAFSSRDWSTDPELLAIYGAVHVKIDKAEPVTTGLFIATVASDPSLEKVQAAQQPTSTSPDVPIAASKTRACVGHGASGSEKVGLRPLMPLRRKGKAFLPAPAPKTPHTPSEEAEMAQAKDIVKEAICIVDEYVENIPSETGYHDVLLRLQKTLRGQK
jgi:hypothetical protein